MKSESTIRVDDTQFFRPAYRNSTYFRLKPGKHKIIVTHPWCFFYPIDMQIYQDGNFVAKVNQTKVTKYPIVVRNMKPKEDPLNIMNHWMFLGFLGFGAFKLICNTGPVKNFKEQIKQSSMQMLEEQKRLQEQMAQQNKQK